MPHRSSLTFFLQAISQMADSVLADVRCDKVVACSAHMLIWCESAFMHAQTLPVVV